MGEKSSTGGRPTDLLRVTCPIGAATAVCAPALATACGFDFVGDW